MKLNKKLLGSRAILFAFITIVLAKYDSSYAQTSVRSISDDEYVLSSEVKILAGKKVKELRQLFAKNDSILTACLLGQQNPEALSEKDRINLLFHMKVKSQAANYFQSFLQEKISTPNVVRFQKALEELVKASVKCIQDESKSLIAVTESYNTLSTLVDKEELIWRKQRLYDNRGEVENPAKIDSVVHSNRYELSQHRVYCSGMTSDKYGKLCIEHTRGGHQNYHLPENTQAEALFYQFYKTNQQLSRPFYDSLATFSTGKGNFRRIYLDIAYLRQGITDTTIANDLVDNLMKITQSQRETLFKTENFASELGLIASRHKENLNVAGSYAIVLYLAKRFPECIAYGTEIMKAHNYHTDISSAVFMSHYKLANLSYTTAMEELQKLSVPSSVIVSLLLEYIDNSTPVSERLRLLDYCKKNYPIQTAKMEFWQLGPEDNQIAGCSRDEIYTFIRFLNRSPKIEAEVNQANHLEYDYWMGKSLDEMYANKAMIMNKKIPYDIMIASGRYCIEEQANGSRNRELIRSGCIPVLKKAHALWPQGYEACELLGDAYFYLGDGNTKDAWYAKAMQLGSTMQGRISYSSGKGKGSRAIKTGKRGGKYYMNSSGNKTYIKR
jgi:hypothetical protein